MADAVHAFDFLNNKNSSLSGFCVAFGDDPFLKRLVLQSIRSLVEDEDSITVFTGKNLEWRDVHDELTTVSLFSTGPRVVLVSDADEFVSNYRPQLEKLCEASNSSRNLIIDVKSLASNTKLYKLAVKHAMLVDCRLPQSARGKSIDQSKIKKWLIQWGRKAHSLKLDDRAADAILDLVGLELGLIDQELAKLALFSDPSQVVEVELINKIVGGWRQKTTWEMLDAAASGNAALAMELLDRLLQSGEHPNALFGSISWSFRRFAQATRAVQRQEQLGQRVDLSAAMLEAGFRKWPQHAFEVAQKQLRQMGRDRAGRLLRWLLETDISLKGSHSSPEKARLAIEILLFKLMKRNRRAS